MISKQCVTRSSQEEQRPVKLTCNWWVSLKISFDCKANIIHFFYRGLVLTQCIEWILLYYGRFFTVVRQYQKVSHFTQNNRYKYSCTNALLETIGVAKPLMHYRRFFWLLKWYYFVILFWLHDKKRQRKTYLVVLCVALSYVYDFIYEHILYLTTVKPNMSILE